MNFGLALVAVFFAALFGAFAGVGAGAAFLIHIQRDRRDAEVRDE